MTVKEHYDNHLAAFYAWMTGDFESRQQEFLLLIQNNSITPTFSGKAIDLGAGHGIQSVALARMGFKVVAVDFNEELLNELKAHEAARSVIALKEDIRNIKQFAGNDVELIVCCGDTLSHLESRSEIEILIADIASVLKTRGKAILSFRDYSSERIGDSRFIPVRSDDTRILTCILDFETDRVRVTDLLHEKTEKGWQQKVSSYYKVRISPDQIRGMLETNGMKVAVSHISNGMTTLIASKI